MTVLDDDGSARAYATFRRKENWADGGPAGIVRVREAAAVDAAATHRLWSFLLDLDLMATVESPMLPADDPLLLLLVDQRGAQPRLTDNVWVRLLDLPVALAGRRYSAPLDVVLDVTDTRLPANAGRWRLTTGERGADGAWSASVRADRRRRGPGRSTSASWAPPTSAGAPSPRRPRAGLVVERTAGRGAGDRCGVRVVRRAGVQLGVLSVSGSARTP